MGIKVNPTKIVAVRERPKPKTSTNIHSIIGLVGYYQRFIKHFSKIAGPLTKLTRNVEPLIWAEKHEEAF